MRHSIGKLVLVVLLINLTSCNIIIKPSNTQGFQAAYVFMQGAEIPAINYKQYALDLQAKFNGSLWIALAEFPLNTPEPILVNEIMNNLYGELEKAGFNYDSSTPFFFAGHSLGGIIAQDYLFSQLSKLKLNATGLILQGSFIQRTNLEKSADPKFPPILTLGGELDGLARVFRMAESYYFNTNSPNVKDKTYTIIIPGMNHYQFCGAGNPPPTVVKNDIIPEINNTVARNVATSLMIAYMHHVLGMDTAQDMWWLADYIQSTISTVNPILDAFNMEGFYHFKPPCSSKKSLKPPNCTIGSAWTPNAQLIMASISGNYLNIVDEFHPAAGIPEVFAKLHNNCSSTGTPCILNITSVTQNVYEILDKFDIGLQPVASVEVRTKMISRQSVLQAFSLKPYDFNKTDAISICGQINQESINYALKNAPLVTLKRYLNRGKQLKPVDDEGPLNNGFLWINSRLKFTEKSDPNTNKTYVELASPTLRLPTDYSIKAVAGFHYCKLLSPARAMEWLFTDSLKP